ncbi:MAG: Asp23/Gls24 family envelope stress response protein [Ruminococcus sp.]|jgi:uncharacterized alkaline shock family protein YloU|nr:Asp23/Gls24 family envelope stress response protein [Ruminococcus sp.]
MDTQTNINTTEKRLKISKDALEKICYFALKDCGGDISVKPKVKFKDLFGQRIDHVADVDFKGDSAEISISITLPEDIKAAAAAEKIQRRIISDVRSMTGITVSKVNIIIAGLTPEKKENPQNGVVTTVN